MGNRRHNGHNENTDLEVSGSYRRNRKNGAKTRSVLFTVMAVSSGTMPGI